MGYRKIYDKKVKNTLFLFDFQEMITYISAVPMFITLSPKLFAFLRICKRRPMYSRYNIGKIPGIRSYISFFGYTNCGGTFSLNTVALK